jgi:hypothetical protein
MSENFKNYRGLSDAERRLLERLEDARTLDR